MRITLLSLQILLSTSLWTFAVAAEPREVPISVDSAGAIRVAVSINGQSPLTFLVDTGSSHSMVSSKVAARFGLRDVAKSTMLTSAGSEIRPIVSLASISIGSATVHDLMPSVVTPAQLDALVRNIDGIVGQDFLSAFNYTLDYRRKRLLWSANAAPDEGAVHLPLVRAEGRFLVQLPADEDQSPVMLVPDSGAEAFIIYDRGRQIPLALDPQIGSTQVIGVTGQRGGVREMTLRKIRVGSVTVRGQRAVLLDRRGLEIGGDGLMPLHVFGSVTFNTQEGYMIVKK